jgi:hypothetical protein
MIVLYNTLTKKARVLMDFLQLFAGADNLGRGNPSPTKRGIGKK